MHRAGRTFTRKARSTALERGEHGREAYRQGCRCSACVDAFRRYHRDRWARLAVARSGVAVRRVPVARAAVHVGRLRAAGWSVPKIAAEAGCSPSTVLRLERLHARGVRARCWSTFEAAVLAIPVKPPAVSKRGLFDTGRARDVLADVRPVRARDPLADVRPIGAREAAALRARGYSAAFLGAGR